MLLVGRRIGGDRSRDLLGRDCVAGKAYGKKRQRKEFSHEAIVTIVRAPETIRNSGDKGMQGIPYVCPDFVIELRSKSDSLRKTQAKKKDWIAKGASLTWLIDPHRKRVLSIAREPTQPSYRQHRSKHAARWTASSSI